MATFVAHDSTVAPVPEAGQKVAMTAAAMIASRK
jgi:hypothetical protein